MKNILLIFGCLVLMLLLAGCVGGDLGNCKNVAQYKTVNQFHCEQTSDCECTHRTTIMNDCDSCRCFTGYKMVCG